MANSVSSSVQFVGEAKVLRAFASRGIASWALFCNKQFLFKHEGSDMVEAEAALENTLLMLEGSRATYTLCVYDDLKENEKIKSTTANDGSFNFQLVDKANELPGGNVSYELRDMMREVRENQLLLEAKLEMAKANDDDEPKANVIGFVKEVMSIQGVPEILGAVVAKLFPAQTLGRVGNIPEMLQHNTTDQGVTASAFNGVKDADNDVNEMSENEAVRLGECYGVLRVKFPGCLGLLERLRDMAINDPAKFENVKNTVSAFI